MSAISRTSSLVFTIRKRSPSTVMEFITFDPSSGATPGPNMLDETLLTFPIYAPVQSVGATQWAVLDADPGSVIIACFVPDPVAGGIPHALEGMVNLVPVAES